MKGSWISLLCAGALLVGPVGDLGARGLSEANEMLLSAVAQGNLDGVRLALVRGAFVDARDTERQHADETPLIRASFQGDRRAVALLLRHGANVNAQDARGETALLSAVAAREPAIAARLLAAGADPNLSEHRGLSPLAVAADRNSPATLRLLLRHGAKPTSTHGGTTPLMLAAKHGPTAARILLSSFDDTQVNAQTQTGTTALMIAAFAGQLETVNLLLAAGANAQLRHRERITALYFALSPIGSRPEIPGNVPEIARRLIEYGALRRGEDEQARLEQALPVLAAYSRLPPPLLNKTIAILIAGGADPERASSTGYTAHELFLRRPIQWRPSPDMLARLAHPARTSKSASRQISELCATIGGSPYSQSNLYERPAQKFTAQDDARISARLAQLIAGNSLEPQQAWSYFGRFSCGLAAESRGLPETLSVLIGIGHDPDWPSIVRFGNSRIHSAFPEWLQARRPDPKSKEVITILMAAAAAADQTTLDALVDYGVSIRARDDQGRGAIDHAFRSYAEEIPRAQYYANTSTHSQRRLQALRAMLERLHQSHGLRLQQAAQATCLAIEHGDASLRKLATRLSAARPTRLRCIDSQARPLLYGAVLSGNRQRISNARAAGIVEPAADLLQAVRAQDAAQVRRMLRANAPVYPETLFAAFVSFPQLEASPLLLTQLLAGLRRLPERPDFPRYTRYPEYRGVWPTPHVYRIENLLHNFRFRQPPIGASSAAEREEQRRLRLRVRAVLHARGLRFSARD